jgi:hypothetical protein
MKSSFIEVLSPGQGDLRPQHGLSQWATAFVQGTVVVISLSTILVFVSYSLTFAHLGETIANQYATVNGQPFVFDGRSAVIEPFYNRILFPAILVSTRIALPQLTDAQTFLLLRFFSFIICLTALYQAVYRRTAKQVQETASVCFVVALAMLPTFNHGWVHTSDIFDLTFSFFIFLYLAEQKFSPALIVALLTAVNRETGAFAGVVYVCLFYRKEKPTIFLLRSIILGFFPYGGAILVRKIVLGHQIPPFFYRAVVHRIRL